MTGGATTDPATDPARSGHVLRPAATADLPICAAIWRESLNDYLGRLGQPDIPDELAPILRLYQHLLATDPQTFVVAERAGQIEAFVVVVRRERLTFLSMLFVRPGAQGRGLGRALLARTMGDDTGPGGDDTGPGGDGAGWRATATDSAQPISNGLYGSLGIVPRMPLLRLVGLPERAGAFAPLPEGIVAIPFDEIRAGSDGIGHSALDGALADLDRDAAGFDRAADHRFHGEEGRVGFLLRDAEGRSCGYGYTSEAGRLGPVAVRDAELLGPFLGHLVTAVRPRGAFGVWVPGAAGEAVVPLLRSGFRIDGFPVLLCWDRPFADFSRYLPASPGLL
ncbi:MAG TPA: GNAT family N-acetyltransferase [Candidatus Limnocylindrales bacterium]|nr:GNAT family N-acetyltransferase [Candidatus Limnocylindrales bacterium]